MSRAGLNAFDKPARFEPQNEPMEFMSYWWRCILDGWTLFDGLSAVLQGLLALAIGFVAWRRSIHDDIKWEAKAMKVLSIILLASFVLSSIFVAPFLRDREKRKATATQNEFIKSLDGKNRKLTEKLEKLDEEKGKLVTALLSRRAGVAQDADVTLEHLRGRAKPLIDGLRDLQKRFFADFLVTAQPPKSQLPYEDHAKMQEDVRQQYIQEYTTRFGARVENMIDRLLDLGINVRDLEEYRPSPKQFTFDVLANVLEKKFDQKSKP